MMLCSFAALKKKFSSDSVIGVWGVQIPAFVLFRFLFDLAVCLRRRSNCLLGFSETKIPQLVSVTLTVLKHALNN